ncbi:MAG: YicC family protein [Pseudomonadales bacterium]|nr:YicC family protein [Pseudomonadales bacterium]MCP5204555.1 YicC family protein [Pseudomonadales bacterium]
MIHSMTAFARESDTSDEGVLTVELRSVNHRYLDCSFKLPDPLRALEPALREQAGKALARGKLDCLIRLQSHTATDIDLEVSIGHLDKLLAATRIVTDRMPTASAPNALEILQFPGVCSACQGSEEALHRAATALFAKTLAGLTETRRREGQKLAALVLDRLRQVEAAVADIRTLLPALLQHQHDRIVARIEELSVEIDSNRLEQELVHLAQKADVDEELDRLEAHVEEVRHTLEKGGPCGRRLDFLMQELNREANTLSSKSIASATTQHAVSLKVLIEQMREQIQNIE